MTAIKADLAVNNSDLYPAPYPFEVSYNKDPGTFSILLDGSVLANHSFAPILSGTVQRAQLQAFADVSAGAHTLEFLITRNWAPSLSLTQYIDNISVSAVPEPGIAALFGSGLFTLLVVGRAKRRSAHAFSPRAAK